MNANPFTLFLSLAMYPLPCGCAPARAAAPQQEIPFERYQLQNGLTVIFHVDHRLPQVALNLWYHVGSKDEPPGRSGFAHLFEHLMFMGTQQVPEGSFDRIMESAGGSNNASTSQDRTNYFEQGPSNLLETLLFLEADRLRTLGRDITQKKLDLQREVVRNERRQTHENRPYGKAHLEMWPLLYPAGHPYHNTIIGSHQDLEAASLDDVRSFFTRHYVPNNASLVVAGDFDPALARVWIEKYFGGIPAAAAPPHAAADPVRLKESISRTLTDRVQLPRTMLIYHSPASYQEGDAELDLAAFILGEGKSSRLYRLLVYEKAVAQDVDAEQASARLGSLFMIQATARPGVALVAIEQEIDAAIREFQAQPPAEREVTRAKNKKETVFWRQLEALGGRADLLNGYQFHFQDPGALHQDMERFRQATPEKIQAWAKQVLRPEARLVLRIVPEAAGESKDGGPKKN